jgi:hypothetical protein
MKAIPVLLAVLAQGAAEPPSERAHEDRTIVYFLNAPDTHSFDLYHDYTESKEGMKLYLNVVRKGSAASKPSARNLDTGESLTVETLKGEAIKAAGLDIGEPIRDDSEVVVAHFAPVPKGGSSRLRISETYTDPASYRLAGDELVWERTLGRPRNAVVLPPGYFLETSTVPAVVSETEDGRIRLDFTNPRSDELPVLLKARKRKAP